MTIDLQTGATDKWVVDQLGIRHPLHDPPTPRLVKIWFEGKTDCIVFENELGITIDSDHVVVTETKYIELWSKFKWLRDNKLKTEVLST